jgi:hypothetical protein
VAARASIRSSWIKNGAVPPDRAPEPFVRRLVHAARLGGRLDVGLALQPLQAREFLAQRPVLRQQPGVLFQQAQRQRLQRRRIQGINVERRLDHARSESQSASSRNQL